MAQKSASKTAKQEYYGEPEEKPKKHYIVYHQPSKWSVRPGVSFDTQHGFSFREGIVYCVDDLVYEWSKRQRGFYEIIGLDVESVVHFK